MCVYLLQFRCVFIEQKINRNYKICMLHLTNIQLCNIRQLSGCLSCVIDLNI